jgi:hypothetical protein
MILIAGFTQCLIHYTGMPPVLPPVVRPMKPVGFLKSLGPGLVTWAADDDPSGIATYNKVGAQFGYSLAWTHAVQLSSDVRDPVGQRGVAA